MEYPPKPPLEDLVPRDVEFMIPPEGEPAELTDKDLIESYEPIFAEQVQKLALLGKKKKDIADFFDVPVRIISRWEENHPEFYCAMRDGMDMADANVAKALYDRAVGMEFDEEVTHFDKMSGEFITKTVKRRVLPDVNAATRWLQSRQSETWRESKQLEVTTEKPKTMSDLFESDPIEHEPDDKKPKIESKKQDKSEI